MRHTVNEAVALQKIGTAKAVPILAEGVKFSVSMGKNLL